MADRITTPISILMLVYLMIVGFCFIILALACLTAHDINHYLKTQNNFEEQAICQSYLNQGNYESYQTCIVKTLPIKK